MNHLDVRGAESLGIDAGARGVVGRPGGREIRPALGAGVKTTGTDGGPHVAGELVARWSEIEANLAPIIGRGGAGALYRRSLRLTAAAHPWLQAALEGSGALMDLPTLHAVLARQTSGVAAVGGAALLQTFLGVLTSLVGPRLTDQLIGSRRHSPFRA